MKETMNVSNRKKGKKSKSYQYTGEELITKELDGLTASGKILTNVYVPKANGATTEIDLIYIHQTGIYVIESKEHIGHISGSSRDKEWTKTVWNDDKKTTFYNPLKQNHMHMVHLAAYLDKDKSDFKSIVVFRDLCNLQRLKLNEAKDKVITITKVRNAFDEMLKTEDIVFTQKQINEFYEELKPLTQVSDKVKQDHIDRIQNYKKPINKEMQLNIGDLNIENMNKEEGYLIEDANTDTKEVKNVYKTIANKREGSTLLVNIKDDLEPIMSFEDRVKAAKEKVAHDKSRAKQRPIKDIER